MFKKIMFFFGYEEKQEFFMFKKKFTPVLKKKLQPKYKNNLTQPGIPIIIFWMHTLLNLFLNFAFSLTVAQVYVGISDSVLMSNYIWALYSTNRNWTFFS